MVISARNLSKSMRGTMVSHFVLEGSLSKTEEGPFRSHYLYRERGTVLLALSQHVAIQRVNGGSYQLAPASPGPRPGAGSAPIACREAWRA